MLKINRALLPDICFDKDKGIFAYGGSKSPLEQALNAADKSLYLVAAGGVGKTTSLYAFWLDYLQGKHNLSCLFVDLKLLNKDKKENALAEYISNEYKLKIDDSPVKPLLLLDGANELAPELRHGEWCDFVIECRNFINAGWRIVISGRSDRIGMGSDKREFSEIQYATLSELTDEQLSMITNLQVNGTLSRLLHNNMMLFIYLELKQYGVEIPPEKVTAGMLLKLYIDICIKVRYIQNYRKVNIEEKELYKCLLANGYAEEIKEHGGNLKVGECAELTEPIVEGCEKYNKIQAALLEDPIGLHGIIRTGPIRDSLKHLSLIEEVRGASNRYIWTNELYQEFFEALFLVKILKIEGPWSDDTVAKFIRFRDRIWQTGSLQHYYDVLQFAGEIGMFTEEEWEELYLRNIGKQIITKNTAYCDVGELVEIFEWPLAWAILTKLQFHEIPIIDYGNEYRVAGPLDYQNIIMIMSVLSGHGIPVGVETIRSFSFFGCTNIEEITIPDNIKKIEKGAFAECKNLKKIEAGLCLEEIEDYAFFSCGLREMKLNSRLRLIGDSAFRCCNLKKLAIEPNIVSIGALAFSGCMDLEEVYLNANISTIERSTFQNCEGLRKVELGSSIRVISDDAFAFCFEMETIKIGPNIEVIGESAFVGCSSLTHIRIISDNTTCKIIKFWAFSGCHSLKTIFLPKNVNLQGSIFPRCELLSDIYCEDERQPESWSLKWLQGCSAQVHWGCKQQDN